MRTLVALVLAVIFGAGTASSQTPSIRPGTYDLAIILGGGQLDGVMALDFKGDSVILNMTVGEHTPAFRTITRTGSKLTLIGGAEGMVVEYRLEFSGDSVRGVLNYNGSDGIITGARRKTRAS